MLIIHDTSYMKLTFLTSNRALFSITLIVSSSGQVVSIVVRVGVYFFLALRFILLSAFSSIWSIHSSSMISENPAAHTQAYGYTMNALNGSAIFLKLFQPLRVDL